MRKKAIQECQCANQLKPGRLSHASAAVARLQIDALDCTISQEVLLMMVLLQTRSCAAMMLSEDAWSNIRLNSLRRKGAIS
jgi:hypothetical protein